MLWRYLCYTVALIFGAGMILGGSFVLYSIPTIFSEKIKSNLPIVNGTDAYNRYTQSSVPLYAKMYMFNVTNPDDVIKKNAKPILQQVGPFSFTERRRRQVVGISSDNKTLDYKLYRVYYFQQNESVPLDSLITLPNAGAFSAAYAAELKKVEEESAADPVAILQDITKNETIYLTHPAEDWLFKGIKLRYLDALNEDGIYFEDQPPDNKFGFYYKKNDTWDEKADGIMTISTGADGDFANIGRVVKWNGKSELNYWKGKPCNSLKGTDGQFFHPNVQKDEKLDIFAPDLCRTLTIEYVKTTSIRSIELYRFGITASFFKPINYNENTKCYCVKRSHEAKQKFCKLSGLIDVSSCRNKPIVLSTPHFYNGELVLRDKFEGLSPSAANHDTFIDIEPMTGSVLRVRRRLQVNVEMFKSDAFMASNVIKEKLIHPYVWLDQSVTIPDDLAQKLENKLTKMARFLRILCYAALITGPIILIALLLFICRNIRSEDKKIRGVKTSKLSALGKKSANKKKDTGGDYQKIQVIMKPLNTSGGGDNAMETMS